MTGGIGDSSAIECASNSPLSEVAMFRPENHRVRSGTGYPHSAFAGSLRRNHARLHALDLESWIAPSATGTGDSVDQPISMGSI